MSEEKEQIGILVSKEQNDFMSSLSDEECKEVEGYMFELMTNGKVLTTVKERNLFAEFLLLNNASDENKELKEYNVEGGNIKHYAIHSERKLNSISFEITKLNPSNLIFCTAHIFKTREECDDYMNDQETKMSTYDEELIELKKIYNIK